MAKEYTTKDGKKIVGWYRMGGRAIPIVEGQVKKGEGKQRAHYHKNKEGNSYADYRSSDEMRKDIAKQKKQGRDLITTEKFGIKSAKRKSTKRKDNKEVIKEQLKKSPDKGVEKFKRKAKADFEMVDKAKNKKEKKKLHEKAGRDIDEMERRAGGGPRGLADKKQRDAVKESLKRKKDRDYKETDTSEAKRQIENKNSSKKPLPTSNSLSGHMDKNGKLTPEREKVHRKVIDEHLKGKKPAEGQPTLTLFGGGSASGKDSIFGIEKAKKDDHTVVIDPDGIKERLPHFTEMANSSSKAAGFFHEESSALAKRTSSVAYDEGYDTIYNGTGDGSPNSLRKKIEEARKKGYRVEGKYATVDTEEAVKRNELRYEHAIAEGRVARRVDPDEVRKIHANVTNRLVEFAKDFDYVELWDNNGGKGEQKMIATGGGGKGLKAIKGQEKALQKFLDKGDVEFFISPDGYVFPVIKK